MFDTTQANEDLGAPGPHCGTRNDLQKNSGIFRVPPHLSHPVC